MSTLAERIAALPRAALLAIVGGVILVGYFAVVEPALEYRQDLAARAATVEERLANAERRLRDFEANADRLRRATVRHGVVEPPTDARAAQSALRERIIRLAAELGVTSGFTFNPREGVVMQGPLAATFAGINDQGRPTELVRSTFEIRFDAAPETVANFIAQLEASPECRAITSVSLRLGRAAQDRSVSAAIDAETWGVRERESAL
jgi:SHS2 domain-containing protein